MDSRPVDQESPSPPAEGHVGSATGSDGVIESARFHAVTGASRVAASLRCAAVLARADARPLTPRRRRGRGWPWVEPDVLDPPRLGVDDLHAPPPEVLGALRLLALGADLGHWRPCRRPSPPPRAAPGPPAPAAKTRVRASTVARHTASGPNAPIAPGHARSCASRYDNSRQTRLFPWRAGRRTTTTMPVATRSTT